MKDADTARVDLGLALADAEREARHGKVCPLCEYIEKMPEGTVRETLTRAAAGTIGRDKLVAIMRAHGIPAGRRTLERHRREEHTP